MVLRMHVVGGFLAVALIYINNVIADRKVEECSPYPFVSLEHGHIRRISYQKYHFSCNHGHLLVTPSIVRCFRGNWTSLREPKCIKSEGDCDDPPEVDNAIIHGDDRDIGSSVRYTCKPGFQLVGRGDMSCTATRHWDGRTPTCMDEKEPLQKVADRLKKSFVNELTPQPEDDESESNDTIQGVEGRLLDSGSLKHGLDLVLVIDRSSSVDPVDLETAKKFINFLLEKFNVRNEPNKTNGTQAALLTFGTEVQIVFNVNNYTITGPLAASQAVGTIEPNGGGTNVEGALTTVVIQVTPHLRKKSKKALFLMTDGVPNIANNPGITPEDMALTLRNDYKFEIFTVGLGRDIDRNFMAEIASRPPLSHVFILSDYPDLKDLMKILEDDLPPPPPISGDQCGYYEPRGRSNPWVAFLYIFEGGALRRMRMCEGVLICSQWVLTAASCLLEGEERIPKEEIFVTLGETDILRGEQNQTNFYVLDIKLHHKFDSSEPLYNNLALVKLNIPADEYRPACLPRRDMNIPLHRDLNANTSIAGCGINGATPTYPTGATVKIKITLRPISLAQDDECPEKMNDQDMPLFCAGQGHDTCLGLMGSPIIAVDPATEYSHVLGIVAGREHCSKGRNQYIELTKHLHWINHSTESCQKKHWDQE